MNEDCGAKDVVDCGRSDRNSRNVPITNNDDDEEDIRSILEE